MLPSLLTDTGQQNGSKQTLRFYKPYSKQKPVEQGDLGLEAGDQGSGDMVLSQLQEEPPGWAIPCISPCTGSAEVR